MRCLVALMIFAVGDGDRIRLHTVEFESPDSAGRSHSALSLATWAWF